MKKPLHFLLPLLLFVFACQRSETPEGFQTEPGFQLSRVAAEPLIKDPVDLEFNERGDAMVLEMPGYPFEDKQSRLLVLKDRNRDGVYDDSVVFAEGLQLASSFMLYKKGVLVSAPPYLLFLHDEDQNDVADGVDTLMGGFAEGNLQHNYNGLTYGLDNWIYAANGGNDGKPYWWGDSSTVMDLRGQDFRFNPETRIMERLGESSGGFGLGMDEYGRLFETHNLTHVSALVFPERYLKGNAFSETHALENISNHEENGLARIYPIGKQESRVNHPEQSGYFSGSCGITYYGGGAFGEEYDNTVWVADVVLNLVHVDKIKPRGASFEAARLLAQRDFLASADRAFRPVNLTVGPDGAIYVVDMYRTVIEHPEWIPDEFEKTLDLNAGKDKGRIYRIAKAGAAGHVEPARFETEEGLIKSLSHPNQWVRKTAHRLLMERPAAKETVERLRTEQKSGNPLARLHALHILAGKDLLTPAGLAAALSDASAPVRENALVLAEKTLAANPDRVKQCIGLLTDEDQRVRMQAALTLSTLDGEGEAFASHKTAILEGLTGAAKQAVDVWNMLAITLAAQGAAAELFAYLVRSGTPANRDLLASLASGASQSATGLQTVLQYLSDPALAGADRETVLKQINRKALSFDGAPFEPSIKTLEQSGAQHLIPDLAALRRALKLPPSPVFLALSRTALRQVTDRKLPDSTRTQQLSLLALLPYQNKAEVLFECLKNDQPIKLQEGALRQLADYQEVEIGRRLVGMWQTLGPHIRKYAGDLLLDREIHHDALLTGLEKGIINIGEMNFDLERRRTLLWWTDNENTKRRAGKLFSDAGVYNRQAALDKMKPALSLNGNAANGAKMFEIHCANCHRYGAVGKDVGPVLTEISRKSKETLLHDMLDPNAAADPKYISHRLETKEGMAHTGIVAAETDQSITLLMMGGESVTLSKTGIKSFRSLGSSLMMEGFENAMSQQEMADLLEFLQKGNQEILN